MKVWQGCLIALGVFVLFFAAIIGVVFWATGDIVETADDFFAAAAEGDYEKAHSLTYQRLQEQGSPEALEQFLTMNGLHEVTETSWSSRSIENSQGRVEGTVTTKSGGTIPLLVEFVSENDEWKISFIEPQRVGMENSGGGMGTGGMANGAPSRAPPEPMVLPSASDQEDLIFFTTAGFVNALADNDFTSWQTRFADGIALEDLEKNFASFVPLEPQVRRTMMQGPDFEPATRLNDDGNLEIEGAYGGGGQRLRFRYVFSGEGDSQPKLVTANYNFD